MKETNEEQQDHQKCQIEIERLRTRLEEADEEFTQTTLELQSQVDSLKIQILERDDTIAELQGRLDLVMVEDQDKINDERVDLLTEENSQLKLTFTQQTQQNDELVKECTNLHDALDLLQTQMEDEIKLALCEPQQELSRLRNELKAAQEDIIKLRAERAELEQDQQLFTKLIRDLETRNYLIDQLNEEVNQLRSPECRRIIGDGQYFKELFVAVRYRNRRDDWAELGRALGLTEEELQALGLTGPTYYDTEKLSDIWISFLMKEADNTLIAPTVSPSK